MGHQIFVWKREYPTGGLATERSALPRTLRARADGGMVDAHVLGTCEETRGGSSPLPPTKKRNLLFLIFCGGNSVG